MVAALGMVSKIASVLGRSKAAAKFGLADDIKSFVFAGGKMEPDGFPVLESFLDTFKFDEDSLITTGGLSDTDKAIEGYARSRNIAYRSMNPESALDESPNLVVSLPGGEGTAAMRESARLRNLPLASFDSGLINRLANDADYVNDFYPQLSVGQVDLVGPNVNFSNLPLNERVGEKLLDSETTIRTLARISDRIDEPDFSPKKAEAIRSIVLEQYKEANLIPDATAPTSQLLKNLIEEYDDGGPIIRNIVNQVGNRPYTRVVFFADENAGYERLFVQRLLDYLFEYGIIRPETYISTPRTGGPASWIEDWMLNKVYVDPVSGNKVKGLMPFVWRTSTKDREGNIRYKYNISGEEGELVRVNVRLLREARVSGKTEDYTGTGKLFKYKITRDPDTRNSARKLLKESKPLGNRERAAFFQAALRGTDEVPSIDYARLTRPGSFKKFQKDWEFNNKVYFSRIERLEELRESVKSGSTEWTDEIDPTAVDALVSQRIELYGTPSDIEALRMQVVSDLISAKIAQTRKAMKAKRDQDWISTGQSKILSLDERIKIQKEEEPFVAIEAAFKSVADDIMGIGQNNYNVPNLTPENTLIVVLSQIGMPRVVSAKNYIKPGVRVKTEYLPNRVAQSDVLLQSALAEPQSINIPNVVQRRVLAPDDLQRKLVPILSNEDAPIYTPLVNPDENIVRGPARDRWERLLLDRTKLEAQGPGMQEYRREGMEGMIDQSDVDELAELFDIATGSRDSSFSSRLVYDIDDISETLSDDFVQSLGDSGLVNYQRAELTKMIERLEGSLTGAEQRLQQMRRWRQSSMGIPLIRIENGKFVFESPSNTSSYLDEPAAPGIKDLLERAKDKLRFLDDEQRSWEARMADDNPATLPPPKEVVEQHMGLPARWSTVEPNEWNAMEKASSHVVISNVNTSDLTVSVTAAPDSWFETLRRAASERQVESVAGTRWDPEKKRKVDTWKLEWRRDESWAGQDADENLLGLPVSISEEVKALRLRYKNLVEERKGIREAWSDEKGKPIREGMPIDRLPTDRILSRRIQNTLRPDRVKGGPVVRYGYEAYVEGIPNNQINYVNDWVRHDRITKELKEVERSYKVLSSRFREKNLRDLEDVPYISVGHFDPDVGSPNSAVIAGIVNRINDIYEQKGEPIILHFTGDANQIIESNLNGRIANFAENIVLGILQQGGPEIRSKVDYVIFGGKSGYDSAFESAFGKYGFNAQSRPSYSPSLREEGAFEIQQFKKNFDGYNVYGIAKNPNEISFDKNALYAAIDPQRFVEIPEMPGPLASLSFVGSSVLDAKGQRITGGGAYIPRTVLNAQEGDVTISIALNPSTEGENLTKLAARGLVGYKKDIGYDGKLRWVRDYDVNKKETRKNIFFSMPHRAKRFDAYIDDLVKALNAAYKTKKNSPLVVNVAGNGAGTMKELKVANPQWDADIFSRYVFQAILSHPNRKFEIGEVISGGQNGYDIALVKAAMLSGIPTRIRPAYSKTGSIMTQGDSRNSVSFWSQREYISHHRLDTAEPGALDDLGPAVQVAPVPVRTVAPPRAALRSTTPASGITEEAARTLGDISSRTKTWAQSVENGEPNFEVSSAGDKRFSAGWAEIGNRTIEDIWQVDFKGGVKNGPGRFDYTTKSKDPAPGSPASKMNEEEQYAAYKNLWVRFFASNPQLLEEASRLSRGKVITDKYARRSINQARAIDDILTERGSRVPPGFVSVDVDGPIMRIPMWYRDGSNGLRMRREFRGMSTMDLIIQGNRTGTTRSSKAQFQKPDGAMLRVGDIVEFYDARVNKSVKVRVTKEPYRLPIPTTPQEAKSFSDTWSKYEGWDPSYYERYQGQWQMRYELI